MIGWSVAAWLACVVVIWLFIRGATRKPGPRRITLRDVLAKQTPRGKLSRREALRRARERGAL